jgi:hypothetical protein
MNKRRIIALANICLCTFPPLVGFYGVSGAIGPLVPQDSARAFFVGLVTGLSFGLLAVYLAFSISPGE